MATKAKVKVGIRNLQKQARDAVMDPNSLMMKALIDLNDPGYYKQRALEELLRGGDMDLVITLLALRKHHHATPKATTKG